jgi:hypothetical protein
LVIRTRFSRGLSPTETSRSSTRVTHFSLPNEPRRKLASAVFIRAPLFVTLIEIFVCGRLLPGWLSPTSRPTLSLGSRPFSRFMTSLRPHYSLHTVRADKQLSRLAATPPYDGRGLVKFFPDITAGNEFRNRNLKERRPLSRACSGC